MRTHLSRLADHGFAVVGVVRATSMLAGQPVAAAHVSVTPDSVVPGERATVAFRMPDEPGTHVFKALQTCSGGEVVRWIDVAGEGQPEPGHPAPVKPSAAEESTGDVTALVLAVVTWGGRRRAPAAQVTQRREEARV